MQQLVAARFARLAQHGQLQQGRRRCGGDTGTGDAGSNIFANADPDASVGGSTMLFDAGPVDASPPADQPLSEDNACGQGMAEAKLKPVNMLVMFDRSGSMNNNNKWTNASAALTAFFQDPNAAGLRVALRFFPHDNPASGCSGGNNGACDANACSQPLVPIGELTADPAPTDTQEGALVTAVMNSAPGGGGGGGSGTPTYAALDGALRWATSYQPMHPDETTVVVFVTDGMPNGCDENFDDISQLAADALANTGVATYAIGLEGSSTDQMNQLAQAGGTMQAIFIDTSASAEQELVDALNAIRGQALSCDFPMPQASDPGMMIDPAKVNVTFTPSTGMAGTLGQVSDESACGTTNSWYYDMPSAPTRITLCPAACDLVRSDPNAKLEILLGCQTVCAQDTAKNPDQSCGEGGPPAQVPPPL